MRSLKVTGAAIGLVLLATFPAAAADPPLKAPVQTDLGASTQPSERPWAKAVTPAEQKLATDLFREGNGLLKESLFVAAAAKYREALAHWNHPGIHYNLALALLNLDQPVEVFTQLEEAMKYGAAPLDADKFEHAGRYKALIEKQLARVEVTCYQDAAIVSMDGRQLFFAPGRYEGLVRVGQHTIVAQKMGYITTQKSPMLPPGQKTTIDMKLFTADDLTHYKRRWPNWIPWTTLGAGVLLAGVGGILHWQASESFKQYDQGVARCAMAGMTGGCMPDGALAGKKASGENLQVGAFTLYAFGGAAIVAGATLVGLNRARPFRVSPDSDKVSLMPLMGPNGGGLVATIHFQ
jgi:tetratricopeptide (TPR) repeat protein